MTSSKFVLWMACFAIPLLLLVQTEGAQAWLPSGISRFRQRIVGHRRRRRQNKRSATSTQNNATNDNNNNNEEEGEGGVDTVLVSDAEQENEEYEGEEAERKLLSLLPWWEDSWSEAFMNSFPLSPATSYLSSYVSMNSTTAAAAAAAATDGDAVVMDADVEDELSYLEKPKTNPSAKVLHFCFLLHGHRGFSTDLSYLQKVMQHHAELEKKQQQQQQQQQQDDDQKKEEEQPHDMIVHCAVCNEGKTMDGVINGGERLVQEILQVIREELKQRRESQKKNKKENGDEDDNTDDDIIQDITISIVGNSLGGVYGRYAIARLAQKAAAEENDDDDENQPELSQQKDSSDDCCVLLDGKYRLHFNIFCSTASPHLGISKHTYVPIPRTVEVGAAHVLGETGRDLFRLNDLMKTMATCPTFLEPLRKFRKRVAYANAYATDFPVPASTAAFLSSQSTYPHHFADEEDKKNQQEDDDDARRHIVATLHTRPATASINNNNKTPSSSSSSLLPTPEQEAIADDLVQMSYSLDSLGWKKVFIDVRKEIPIRVAIPRSTYKNIRKSLRKSLILSAKLSPSRLRKSLSDVVLPQSTTSTTTSTNGDNDDAVDKDYESDNDSDDDSYSYSSSESESGTGTGRKKRRPSAMHRLRQKGVVESRDVASVVSKPIPDDMRLSFPLGHNLMVALDRAGISGMGGLYKGGRPVMDRLAKELVHDIFDWNFQEETDIVAAEEESMKLSKQEQEQQYTKQ